MKKIFSQRRGRPLPYRVMWYENTGFSIVLRIKSFASAEVRDRYAVRLPKRPGFLRYA
jgi:hypothetical protein